MSNHSQNLTTEELLGVLSQSSQAVAIHVTDQFIIQHASDSMIAVWGKDRSVIGMPLEKALPELKGQPFAGQIRGVKGASFELFEYIGLLGQVVPD